MPSGLPRNLPLETSSVHTGTSEQLPSSFPSENKGEKEHMEKREKKQVFMKIYISDHCLCSICCKNIVNYR